jgi:organic radical activating enzyme|tara:strand:- start:4611 stop:5885 length:1275 start_codon:yes stop_codon:yes gene_type:complete
LLLSKPCLAPFTSVNLDSTGQVIPCCVYNLKGDDKNAYEYFPKPNLADNITDKFNSWDWLRADIKKGKYPSNCDVCKLRGESGKTRADDYRRNLEPLITDEMENPKLLMMDLDLSNKCNLKCLHCGVHSSTGWIKDEAKLLNVNGNKFKRETRPWRSKIKNNNILDLLGSPELTKHLKIVEIKGGEPLYQDQRYDVLDVFMKHDVAKNITLKYVTNMTYKDKKLLELWSNFDKVKLIISTEGTGELYNLIRGHKTTNTDILKDNINWYVTKFHELKKQKHACWFKEKLEPLKDSSTHLSINWSVTAMACNIMDIDNIFDFIESTNSGYNIKNTGSTPTLVVSPDYLDYRVLPKWYIDTARDTMSKSRHASVINFNNKLSYWPEEKRQQKFKLYVDYIEEICRLRKQDPYAIPMWKELKDDYMAI